MTSPTLTTKIRFQGADEAKKAFADIESNFRASAQRMSEAGKKVGAGLTKSVSIAGTTAKATATVASRSFSIMGTVISGINTVIKTSISLLVSMGRLALDVSGKLAIMTAGAIVGVNAFGIKVSQSISDIGKLARAAGVPVEKFSKLAAATRLAGGSVEDLSLGLQTLSDRIIDAAKGGASENYFKQIGVSVRDAAGNIKPTEQVLSEIADGLKAVPSDTLRASAAFDIFGTSATKLLPILEDGSEGLNKYTEQAGKLGTTVSEEQSKKATELLKKSRQVREALLGVSYKVADVLLPELTKNSEKTAAYIAKNGDKIAKIVGKTLKEISGIGADLGRAFTGDIDRIERGWIKRLAPGFKTIKDVVLDLMTMLSGGEAKRAPWLNDVVSTLETAFNIAKALAIEIAKAAGFGDTKLPTLAEAFTAIRIAFESFLAGITGEGEVVMPWAASLGQTAKNLATIYGAVAGEVIKHRDVITAGMSTASAGIAEFVKALIALFETGTIPVENKFEFLNGWIAFAKEKYDTIVYYSKKFAHDVGAAYDTLKGFLKGFYNALDSIAKFLGLENGTQLALVLLILKISGFLGILQTVFGTLSTLLFTINGSIALFKTFLGWIGAGVAAITGLPVAVALAVAAIFAGLAYIIATNIDAYIEVFHTIIDAISFMIGLVVDFFIGAFNLLIEQFTNLWDVGKMLATGTADITKRVWSGVSSFFKNLLDGVIGFFTTLWDFVTSAPGEAWDAMVGVWDGMTDYFAGIVQSVQDYFAGLWDGIANGASNAWSSVKSIFDFSGGSDAPVDGTADKSPRLATGGIIRGAGSGTSDSIRAWLSNGEGVVNARAVGHYGEGFIHALNGLLVPKTHFADGGIVGQTIPAAQSPLASLGNLGNLNLAVDGKRVGSVFVERQSVRAVQRSLNRSASASRGPAPRWSN